MNQILKNKTTFILYAICLLFIAGGAYMLINKKDFFFLYSLLPFVVLILFLAVFKLDNLVQFVIFCTPVSLSLKELGLLEDTIDLSFPTEPILAGIMIIFIFNEIYSGVIDKKFWRHPVTIILLLQILWTIITSLTSEMPLVSIKFLVAKLWFVTTAYFLCAQMFKKEKNLRTFVWLYVISFSGVIVFSIINHANQGLTEDAADWVVKPFYNDHTSYAAMQAMFIPFLAGMIFLKGVPGHWRIMTFTILGLFVLGIVLSYTRAAWVSLFAAMAVGVSLLLRMRFAVLLGIVVSLLGIFFVFQTDIMISLSSNRTDSTGDLGKNIESISNISTDASNLERINRWNCALRMFEEKPVFGFGPGTYMFQYAPYQKSSEKTIISTNAGTVGNAHSEYLGPLSEQGVLGLVLMAALVLSVFFTGYRVVYKLKERNVKIMAIGALLGLSTYFMHGFLNNFLDTDKAAIPFWGMIAMLVALDVYYVNDKEPETKSVEPIDNGAEKLIQ
ncbi:MAG: O-antigen ligase family protein [Bacteroidia bacterium]|nr:O-antigen ligase family protein [Bacteroidia bacterium]